MVVMSLEKIIIRAPRPFFINPELLSNCKVAEFGSPSGHSLVAATCYITTATLFLRYFNSTIKTRALTYTFVMNIVVYTGLARVYEGMHSFDQILSGTI